MFKRQILTAVGAVCLSSVPSASIGANAFQQPAKPWVLDYAETQCVAWRQYGTADHSITLLIRPSPDGGTYELDLVKQRAAGPFAEEHWGSIDFGNGPMGAWVLHYQNVPDKLQISQFRIDSAQMAQARSASSVIFEIGNYQAPVSLALRSMPDLMKGLDQCNVELRRYWNVGVKLSQPARGDVRTIFTNDDYPEIAVSRVQQGTAQFLLFIDPVGKVAACHVLRRSGVAVLDATGCIVIKQRAKFTPARDAAGKPVRDAIVTPPIVWHLRAGH
jgi:hypothetical protein